MTVVNPSAFNAIKALQHKNNVKSIDQPIQVTEWAFCDIPRENLDNNATTLQTCTEETKTCSAGINYKIVHTDKDPLKH